MYVILSGSMQPNKNQSALKLQSLGNKRNKLLSVHFARYKLDILVDIILDTIIDIIDVILLWRM